MLKNNMKLIKAMATVASLTLLSRVAGFLRDILTAAFLGAGPVADAFFVALKLPNLFRRITAEGAFNVSFVPLYTRSLNEDGEEISARFAGNVFTIMIMCLSMFTLVVMAVMPFIISLIAPGFVDEGEGGRLSLAIEMSRITFPYLILISLTALVGGLLNAHSKFGPFAATPILFNLSLIVAVFFFTPYAPSAGHALSWGVFISGFLQFGLVFYFMKKNRIGLIFSKPKFTPKVRKLFKLMGPGVLGAGVMHINLFADMIIASFLTTGAISYLYYADRLNQLPLGVVGIAIGTALLPILSKAIINKATAEAENLFNRSLEYCYLLALPAAAALFVMAEMLISVLFERGAFSSADTKVTATVLQAYAIGLPAYIATKVYASAFWASEDTLSPVKISIKITIVNIVLALLLSKFIGVAGIALATGLAGWLQIVLYRSKLKNLPFTHLDARFKSHMLKIIGATALMVLGLISTQAVVSKLEILPLFKLVGLVSIGGLIYFSALFVLKVFDLSEIKRLLRKQNK